MKDKFGRDISYLRISLTDKCNLRCVYCMDSDVEFEKDYINDNLSFDDYKFIIKSMSELGITKIRFTGGEPLLYPNLKELIYFAKYECGVAEIAITTNAIGLSDRASELKMVGLDSVNISLDSLKEYKYKTITRGGRLNDVLKSINSCLSSGLKVKINCVAINGFNNDEIDDFIYMTSKYPIDVRFIELMPIGVSKSVFNNGYVDMNNVINSIDGIYKVDTNEKSTAKYYSYHGSKGRIGIITPLSCSFCDECNRIRLTHDGKIKLCLHSEEELDLRPYINKPLLFREAMKDMILEKPEKHFLIEEKVSSTNRMMHQIGG